MNAVKKFIHILITFSSLTAFLTGWVFLAHAPKPGVTPGSTATAQSILTSSTVQTVTSSLPTNSNGTRNRGVISNSANPSIHTRTLRTGGS